MFPLATPPLGTFILQHTASGSKLELSSYDRVEDNHGRSVGRSSVVVSGTSDDLAADSHVGGTEGAHLASLLAQGALHAEEVKTKVHDRRPVDLLRLTDITTDETLAEQADAWAADKQQ